MAVVLKYESDVTKVVKDLERLQKENAKLRGEIQKTATASKSHGETTTSAADKGIGAIKNWMAGYVSLSTAINVVNAALANQKRLAAEVHRVQMTAADAQMEVVKNMGGASDEQVQKFLHGIEKVSDKAGMASVAPVYQAAAQVFSAVGDEEVTLAVLENVLPFFKSKPEELPAFGGAVGDLAGVIGAKTPEEMKRVAALVMSSQQFSRGATLESQKEMAMLVKSFANVETSRGDPYGSVADALALGSALSGAVADADTAQTKTAGIEIATALAELLPEKTEYDAEGRVKRQGSGLKTTLERLKAVRADKTLQRRFFETGEGFQMASFRGPFRPVVQSLISDPTTEVSRKLDAALAGITSDPAVMDRMLKNTQATPLLQRADISRRSESRLQKEQLASRSGIDAQTSDILDKALDATHEGLFDYVRGGYAKFRTWDVWGGSDTKQARAEEAIRGRMRQIVNQHGGDDAAAYDVAYRPEFREQGLAKVDPEGRRKIEALLGFLQDLADLKKTEETRTGDGVVAAATLHTQRQGR